MHSNFIPYITDKAKKQNKTNKNNKNNKPNKPNKNDQPTPNKPKNYTVGRNEALIYRREETVFKNHAYWKCAKK